MADAPVTVVFDVGRVLFHWNLRFLFEKLIAEPDELERFVTEVVSEDWHFQSDQGRRLADMVAERSAEFPHHAELIAAYAARFNETVERPIEGSHAIVRRLAERGTRLFALTNFSAEFFAAFRPTQPIFALFKDIVVSGVEGVVKPDPRIYAIAERRFGVPAETLLFIDDNPANITAAKARGWQTHLFIDPPTLERDLVARGLLGPATRAAQPGDS